jgi:hypothetical protein
VNALFHTHLVDRLPLLRKPILGCCGVVTLHAPPRTKTSREPPTTAPTPPGPVDGFNVQRFAESPPGPVDGFDVRLEAPAPHVVNVLSGEIGMAGHAIGGLIIRNGKPFYPHVAEPPVRGVNLVGESVDRSVAGSSPGQAVRRKDRDPQRRWATLHIPFSGPPSSPATTQPLFTSAPHSGMLSHRSRKDLGAG